MDAGFVTALYIIGAGLAVSVTAYCILGGVAWLFFQRSITCILQAWRDWVTRSTEAVNEPKKSHVELYVLPLAGLIVGTLAAFLLRIGMRDKKLDPESIRERLTAAYNPLLMRINELCLSSDRIDAGLAQSYRDIRQELYAQSHLLSQKALSAAARADACLGDPDTRRLAEQLHALRNQIRADHADLQQQLAKVTAQPHERR